MNFLVEYAIYPLSYLKKLKKEDLRQRLRLRTRMLATGKIIFDNFGEIRKLQTEARMQIRERLPEQDKETIEWNKYLLWNQLDNLRDIERRQGKGFAYAYFAGIQEILKIYAAYLCCEVPRPDRVYKFLSDRTFRHKYNIEALPDDVFMRLFEEAICQCTLSAFEQLNDHVQNRMGGFMIDGFILRHNLGG